MKKYLLASILIVSLAMPLAAAFAAEVGPPDSCEMKMDVGVDDCPVSGSCAFTTKVCGMCCLLQTIYGITNWLFMALIAISTVFVIWGALKIVTAKDSAEEVEKGRKYIMYAALGLLVAFLAKAVPQIVRLVSGF